MTTTHNSGVDSDQGSSIDDAANALLSRWTDAEQLSENDEGAKPPRRTETVRDKDEDDNQSDVSDDDIDFGDEDENTDEDDTGPKDALVEAADDAVVNLTVDGEEIKVAVKDLKRLYGQEASLTRKSQEVAQQRQLAEDSGARYVVATQRLLDKANERFQPYASIDWGIAAKTLDNDEYVALRQEAQAAHTDIKFLTEELDGVFTQAQEGRAEALEAEAASAVEILTRDIPNFTAETYTAMTDYAVEQGLDAEAVQQLTDPVALKLIHKAMAYDRAKARAASKRTTTPTSKRNTNSSRRPTGRGEDRGGDALTKLKSSGSRDDAVALLMARAEREGD